MSSYLTTARRTLLAVGKSVLPSIDGFAHLKCPRAIVPSITVDQVKDVVFDIPALANAFAEDEVHRWMPGDSSPGQVEHDTVSVTLSYKGYSTKVYRLDGLRANELSAAQFQRRRFGDAAQRFPILFRRALTIREIQFYNYISSTSVFGAAQSFTNGPLTTPSSNQDPLGQVDDYLVANMNPIQSLTGFKKVMLINPTALAAFRQHPALTGVSVFNGAGGSDALISNQQAIDIMADRWDLDDVWKMDALKTTAQSGETDALGYVTGSTGFMGIYLVKPGVFDLSTGADEPTRDYPDGAFVMAEPRVAGSSNGEMRGLNPDSYTDDEKASEFYRVIYGHDFKTPRASESGLDFGVIWTNITA